MLLGGQNVPNNIRNWDKNLSWKNILAVKGKIFIPCPGWIMQYQPGPSLELSGADAYGQYMYS